MSSERSTLITARPPGLVDVLDRILDKGLVIAGDIKVSLANVELLTLQIRLLVCSIDKAEQIGLNWWRYDTNLTTRAERAEAENVETVVVTGIRAGLRNSLEAKRDAFPDSPQCRQPPSLDGAQRRNRRPQHKNVLERHAFEHMTHRHPLDRLEIHRDVGQLGHSAPQSPDATAPLSPA